MSKKYNVKVPFPVFVTVEVEAESEEDAKDIACQEAYINSYVGNGGMDKLIGVSEGSVEAGEMPIEHEDYPIHVEEIEL